MTKVVVFGSEGLVGSRLVELAGGSLELVTPSLSELDLLDQDSVESFLDQKAPDTILNFAAFTNVDAAEEERDDKQGIVYKLNSWVPQYLAEFAQKNSVHYIQISTDYVFDGKQSDRPYKETDRPNPLSWYGQTKHLGDVFAQESGAKTTIARIEMPFRAKFDQKMDIVRTYLKLLNEVPAARFVEDQEITPCFIDDIATLLQEIVEEEKTGVFHLGPKNSIKPIDLARKLSEMFEIEHPLETISFEEFYAGKPAARPQYCWLDSSSVGLRTIEECLTEFKRQVDSDK